jgi:hypothetical protein
MAIYQPANIAELEANFGLEISRTEDGDLVFRGELRDVVIRRVTLWQVDELRFADPVQAVGAARKLLAPSFVKQKRTRRGK